MIWTMIVGWDPAPWRKGNDVAVVGARRWCCGGPDSVIAGESVANAIAALPRLISGACIGGEGLR